MSSWRMERPGEPVPHRLVSLFADASQFGWCSSGGPGIRSNPKANDRASLTAYFATRHILGDRLRVVGVRRNGNASGGGRTYGNLGFTLGRSAADYDQGAWFQVAGKAAAVCDADGSRFIVMSLGGPRAPARPRSPLSAVIHRLHKPLWKC